MEKLLLLCRVPRLWSGLFAPGSHVFVPGSQVFVPKARNSACKAKWRCVAIRKVAVHKKDAIAQSKSRQRSLQFLSLPHRSS